MNSPTKKAKQSSLSQFYKKPQFPQEQPSRISSSSLTPTKTKPHQHDSNKFAGKIASSLGNSRHFHPLIGKTQEYNSLDINSNMKVKMGDIFEPESGSILKPSSDYVHEQPTYSQNLFMKAAQNDSKFNQFYELGGNFDNFHKNSLLQQPQASDLVMKKFDNSYSDLDYNLSVEPEEIKLPEVYRHENIVNQFMLHDDSKIDANFMITPENSLIKSPEKFINFTPEPSGMEDRKPPSSEVIERLRFNHIDALETSDQKNSQKKSPKRSSESFEKHLNSSPSPPKHPSSSKASIPTTFHPKPSPPISIPRSSPSISQQRSQQILSSDDQDSSQILSKIRQLQSQVTQLKTHKYQFAITKYRQQMKFQLQKTLQASIRQINTRYDTQQQSLQRESQAETILYAKSIEDIGKYKKTYAIILNQLKENKDKIEEEYREKVEQVKKYKERLIHDWKRQSNEDIKKILSNTHVKHSVKLSESKEKYGVEKKESRDKYQPAKLPNYSQGNISGGGNNGKVSPSNTTK